MEATTGSEALWCQRAAECVSANMRAGTRQAVPAPGKHLPAGIQIQAFPFKRVFAVGSSRAEHPVCHHNNLQKSQRNTLQDAEEKDKPERAQRSLVLSPTEATTGAAVEGCPGWIDFSCAASFKTPAMDSSPPPAACRLWKSCLFFRLRLGRNEDLTPETTGAAELSVNRHQWAIEHLGQRHVPSIVAAQVVPQCPYAVGKRCEGKQLQVEAQQIPVCAVRFKSGDFASLFQPAQDITRFGQRQFRTGQRALSDCILRPFPFPPRVDQDCDKHGSVGDYRHVRSASRALKMMEGGTRVLAASLRSRTPCSQASKEGREAIRSNSQRRNSCMDWRCSAARAASSSRTFWGTPRMVICTDMNALCHRRQRSASSNPYNSGRSDSQARGQFANLPF